MTRRPKGKSRSRASETPMMTQYLREKAAHPDALLLFRMGDFYETFFEDAHLLSKTTGIALTSRNAGDADPIPLAGFPWHSSEGHIAKLKQNRLELEERIAALEGVQRLCVDLVEVKKEGFLADIATLTGTTHPRSQDHRPAAPRGR